MEYDIAMIKNGDTFHGIEAEFPDDGTAISVAYFYVGLFRADAARLYRGEHTNPRDPATFITEIKTPMTAAESQLFFGGRMETKTGFGTKRFEMPGRYAVTVECADDLTDDEQIMMAAWFESTVNQLQRREEPGYTEEEAIRWQNEAAGVEE